MAYSECLPTHLNPLAERTCFSQAHATTGGATGLDIDEDVETRPSRHATMFTEPADNPVALTYTKQHRELCVACEVEYGEGDDACMLVCITVPGRVNFRVRQPTGGTVIFHAPCVYFIGDYPYKTSRVA